MNRYPSLCTGLFGFTLSGFISLLFISELSAQSLGIAIYDAQYTTYVYAGGHDLTPISRTTVAPYPISDQVDLLSDPYVPPAGVNSHAIANAGLFSVSEQTYHTTADAEAVSQIWFSPLADQTQTLNIQIGAGLPFDEGQIILLDLTSNSELWDYSWYAYGPVDVPVVVLAGNNIPWDNYLGSANFNVVTDFFSSHQYELTMAAASDARDDGESVNIRLSGLEVVPEPSSAILLALCGFAVAFCRRSK
jgi:hypothetical protein